MGEHRGFCLGSAVNNMVLLSKSGNGQFDVLILHEDTILCNEGDLYKSHPEVKPMRTRSEKEKEHRMMHWSFCKIGNCPCYDRVTPNDHVTPRAPARAGETPRKRTNNENASRDTRDAGSKVQAPQTAKTSP